MLKLLARQHVSWMKEEKAQDDAPQRNLACLEISTNLMEVLKGTSLGQRMLPVFLLHRDGRA
jgi:hypothetical protein